MRPVLSVLLSSMAGESQACQQPNTTAKPPLNTSAVTAPSSTVGMLWFFVAAADLLLGFLWFGDSKRFCEVTFSNSKHVSSCGKNEPLSGISATVVY